MSGSAPAIRVVMPVLNEARFIRESIESLLAQHYDPLEIVVYDGGSTDGTLDILREYPVDLRVEPGLGQMAAINRGWQGTSAEYVTWWAGDDRYKPGALARLAAELRDHPEAGFVHADADIIDEQGMVTRHLAPGPRSLADLALAFTMVSQTALIRRSAAERAGLMDETRRFAADWDFFLRVSQYHPGHYVPFTAAEYRTHSGSEDNQNYARVGEAGMDVVARFFERPDLTPAQRALRPRALAGARLFAGWCYVVEGRRGDGWRMLRDALLAAPSVLWRVPAGPRLVGRLLLPGRPRPHRPRGGWRQGATV